MTRASPACSRGMCGCARAATLILVSIHFTAIEWNRSDLPPLLNGWGDEDTAEEVGVSAEVLSTYAMQCYDMQSRRESVRRTAVHDDVRTPFEGVLDRRRGEGGIDEQPATSSMDL